MTTNRLHNVIKHIAVNAVSAEKPVDVVYGNIISTKPLLIKRSQKLILDERFIVLTDNMKEHTKEIQIDGDVKNVIYPSPLKEGDRVIMLKFQRGQRFLVIDKL